jgi:hypothetical protein
VLRSPDVRLELGRDAIRRGSQVLRPGSPSLCARSGRCHGGGARAGRHGAPARPGVRPGDSHAAGGAIVRGSRRPDADRDMLLEAERLAAERGVTNARGSSARRGSPRGSGVSRDHLRPVVPLDGARPGGRHHARMLEPEVWPSTSTAARRTGSRARRGAIPAPPEAAIAELVRAYRRSGAPARPWQREPDDEDACWSRWLRRPGPRRCAGRAVLERTVERLSRNGCRARVPLRTCSGAPAGVRGGPAAPPPPGIARGRFCVQLPDNQLKIWRPTNTASSPRR